MLNEFVFDCLNQVFALIVIGDVSHDYCCLGWELWCSSFQGDFVLAHQNDIGSVIEVPECYSLADSARSSRDDDTLVKEVRFSHKSSHVHIALISHHWRITVVLLVHSLLWVVSLRIIIRTRWKVVGLVIAVSWSLELVLLHSAWSIVILHASTEILVLLPWSEIICLVIVALWRNNPLLLIILLLLHWSVLLLLARDKVILIGHTTHRWSPIMILLHSWSPNKLLPWWSSWIRSWSWVYSASWPCPRASTSSWAWTPWLSWFHTILCGWKLIHIFFK